MYIVFLVRYASPASMHSLFNLLKRVRARMHGQGGTRQHHVVVACCGGTGLLGADPG